MKGFIITAPVLPLGIAETTTRLCALPHFFFIRYERGKKHSVSLCCAHLSPSDI